jgi:hypothetical protein
MNAIFLKFWKWFTEKNHALVTILLLLFIAMGTIIYFQHLSVVKYKDKYETEVKLKNALLDSIDFYQNREKEWVAEKLTIQETLENLQKINGQLTDFQKELLRRIVEMNKKYDVIAAALIQTNVKIDSLLHVGKVEVDTVNKTAHFADSSVIVMPDKSRKIVEYDLLVTKVLPAFPNVKPGLMINSIYFPNKQFIEFHWEKNKKANYPVAFSVSNSNGYFKTVNIDSYAIPDIKYEGSKFDQWMAKNGKMLLYLGIGAGGATALWLLAK